MPIYEYRCAACRRRASLFFRSISVAESDPRCPDCGERRLERLMSRVWSRRGSNDDDAYPQPTYEEDGVPFYGPDPYSDPFGGEALGEPMDQEGSADGEDVAAMAREAREMARMMGEPLDREFDDALRHVEHGADPDDVFGEMDAKATLPDAPEPGDEP